MRIRSAVIFGLGYLLGTKAGRERYREIADSLQGIKESDTFRQYLDMGREYVNAGLRSIGVPPKSALEQHADRGAHVSDGGSSVTEAPAGTPAEHRDHDTGRVPG